MTRALVVLSALLLATAARAAQELPAYPGTALTRIGSDLEISGELYRIGYFVTADSPQTVAKYFLKEWKREGYPTTLDGTFRDEGVVSAFYTREGLMRSVVVRRLGAKTLALAVLKDLWAPAPKKGPQSPGILEGTLFSQELSSRDAAGARHRTSLVERSLEATREGLQQRLASEKFKLSRETAGKNDRVLEFARGTEQLIVTLTEVSAEVTALSQTWLKP